MVNTVPSEFGPTQMILLQFKQFTSHLMIQSFESHFYFVVFYLWGHEVITQIPILYFHRYKIILSQSIQYVGKHLHGVCMILCMIIQEPHFLGNKLGKICV